MFYYGIFRKDVEVGDTVAINMGNGKMEYHLLESIENDWNGNHFQDEYKLLSWENEATYWTSSLDGTSAYVDLINTGCSHLVLNFCGIGGGGYHFCQLCGDKV